MPSIAALAENLEHLLQALDLAFGLVLVLLEGLLELVAAGGARHLGERLQDLPLGVIDVLERVVEKVF